MKILTVVGARPQFVKAAALSRAIQKETQLQEILVHTGQHYDENMSKVFFEEMSIPKPDYRLATGGKSHGAMTGQMLIELEPIVQKEKPDLLLVYGDTNSTLAGALVAAKLHIPVAHVEAGLRSFNMQMPEEINRILTDRVSRWLFCPTETAKKHLLNEGVAENSIYNVGDIMLDTTLFYKEFLKPRRQVAEFVEAEPHFALCTIHRAENTDDPERLAGIFRALEKMAEKGPIFLPLHPRTKKCLQAHSINLKHITVVDPVPYGDILYLLGHCQYVLTDSGGMQKEAYFFSKPCITLRDETEWVETIEKGVNFLVGGQEREILKAFENMTSQTLKFPKNLYGDGRAAEKIIEILKR